MPSDKPLTPEEAYRKWANSLPKCAPDCDGDLVGLEHEPNCPMRGKKLSTMRDAFEAGFREAVQQTKKVDAKIAWQWAMEHARLDQHDAKDLAAAIERRGD